MLLVVRFESMKKMAYRVNMERYLYVCFYRRCQFAGLGVLRHNSLLNSISTTVTLTAVFSGECKILCFASIIHICQGQVVRTVAGEAGRGRY